MTQKHSLSGNSNQLFALKLILCIKNALKKIENMTYKLVHTTKKGLTPRTLRTLKLNFKSTNNTIKRKVFLKKISSRKKQFH